ncbi:uncharacterized protein si:dkey-52l18.4 [Clupea harengus]|uniref:Uncharacterized protein si:dkey-52l18.4 n=1 Tax=Clupea harengus TaxID=7950 RepID=A0A6P8G0U0_CLUHA|nr:uncharacterized protein si:dkey-52l18.4 [Clupea harengus]
MGPVIGCYVIITLLYHNLGCSAAECFNAVKARRDRKEVFEGSSLSLSCEVEHCGRSGWTGGWGVVKEDTFSLLQNSPRLHIYKEDLTINSTRLNINFIRTNISDTGTYQCRINWGRDSISNGHVTFVNVTDTPPKKSERTVLLRVFVCVCACFSFPLALVLARCLSHPAAPPVPPRLHSAATQSRTGDELVYADLTLENAGASTQNPPHTEEQPVIYSLISL